MKKILFLCLVCFLGFNANAQQCGEVFTDSGGATGNYDNNTDSTTTICPTNPGDVVTVTFTAFSTEATFDVLYIFDGNSINAPQFSSGNLSGNVPGGLPGGFWGNTLPGQFTSTSADGCLTFRFRSDASVYNPGWIANITCAPRPTCPRPAIAPLLSVGATSATMNWNEPGNATAWDCIAVPIGSPVPTADATGFVTANTHPFLYTGLTPLTCYTFYVRAACSDTDKSVWSAGVNGCTTAAPPACGGQFIDNGGAAANYSANQDNITTICPQNPGDIVFVSFDSFNTEAEWDALYVFDGASIAAQQISSTNPSGNVPGGMSGGFWGNTIPGPFVSTSPDGCLTFRFRSDGSVQNPGWVANVVCNPSPEDRIILIAFVDSNNNGIKDVSEALFPYGSFVSHQNNSGTNANLYSPAGQYTLHDSNPANTYNFSYELQSEFAPYYNPGNTTYNNISIAAGSGLQTLYFPVVLTQNYNDVTISIDPYEPPRPGAYYSNRVTYKNQGVTGTNGTITFVKPTQVTTYNTSQTGIVTNATGFTYAFSNLMPNESRVFYVYMLVPTIPIVNINELLIDNATISAPTNDAISANNTSTNSQIVVASYDPNDKMESRGKTIPFDTFAPDDYFYYTIRFQNNGTANAIDVRIEDVLNINKIDETSVRMISSSHNYSMKRINNQLVWDFKNIQLPPASVSENGSKGFVKFKVKLKPGFAAGDIIPNNASIFFDTNPAIVTATFNSKFTVPLSVSEFNSNSLVLYPNPADNLVQIDLVNTNEQLKKIVFYDILGKAVKTVAIVATESLAVDVSDLSKGVYLVEITSDTNLKLTKKLVIQ